MPFRNPNAEQLVFNSDATPIKGGCGFILAGGSPVGGVPRVKHCTAADQRPDGVAQADIAASAPGVSDQVGMGNTQLRLASAITLRAPLRIANVEGEFEVAPSGSKNVCYSAGSAGAAGTDTTWGIPIGTAPASPFISTVLTGDGTAQSTPHGLGAAPAAVKAWLVQLPAGISLLSPVGITAGTHTATNCVFTVTNGVKYQVEASL